MTKTITVLLTIFIQYTAYAQCIDKEKIQYGGDYGHTKYIHLCPTYSFAFGGDTTKSWNILGNPISIQQAPANVLKYKRKVDDAIKAYAGNRFCSDLHFQSVDVVYPERLQAFKDSGRWEVTLKHYKAKYLYYYEFEPDTASSYLIGVAVSKDGRIISPFNFPSKKEYKPIDKAFTYCKLIDIATKVQKHIDPIESIKFEYDTKRKRFYWRISQEVVNSHEGLNHLNQVFIDAADLTKTRNFTSHVSIIY
jgi:hypothetical protein